MTTPLNRRSFLVSAASAAAAAELASNTTSASSVDAAGRPQTAAQLPLRRIAVEEAFTTPEHSKALSQIAGSDDPSLDIDFIRKLYTAPRSAMFDQIYAWLHDLERERIRIMDENGVAMQVLSLTSPGVQMLNADSGVALAALSNDRLAEVIARHPTRFAGLAAVAPQDPARAAKEMERAVKKLGLSGFIINSHTQNRYLDEPHFWAILEAAEALDRPIYLHPRSPSDGMATPFRDYDLAGAKWGYAVETGTHVMRILESGVLDRFPKLQIVIGHMGELIPFHLWRINFMSRSYHARAGLKLMPSEYLIRNFTITTSGVEDPDALELCLKKFGPTRLMWAIDFPYQQTKPAVEFLDNAPVSDADRAMIFGGNAERVFKLSPSAA